MNTTDQEFMTRALALAERGRGRVSPNPMVGCVIVRDSAIIGEGWHQRVGEAHAEVNAVADAGGDLQGATVYVTLEPCSHQGRTPPCAALLVEKQPARVVVAMQDPNPQVAGRGLAQLRAAGIAVETGVLEAEAQQLNEIFIKYITTGLPFVVAKCGMTLDGKIATHTGNSQWVTGEAARLRVHQWRNELDAILVGSRTVKVDDPSLTTRLGDDDRRDPVRVILDAGASLHTDSKVFHLESNAPTWVATTKEREYPGAAQVIQVPKGPSGIDLKVLMTELGKREIASLLIEGGGATHASAFEAGIVDKVCFFIAPKIIGGRNAVSAVEGQGVETMEEAILLDKMTVTPIGDDILVEAYVQHKG